MTDPAKDEHLTAGPRPVFVAPAGYTATSTVASRRGCMIFAAAAAVVLLVCAGVPMIQESARNSLRAHQAADAARAAAVVDAYMQAMQRKDTAAAYALFSARARAELPAMALEELVADADYVLFDRYLKLDWQERSFFSGPPFPVPAGFEDAALARLTGNVIYTGSQGKFEAALEKDQGVWQLFRVDIEVPMDKIKAYLDTQ